MLQQYIYNIFYVENISIELYLYKKSWGQRLLVGGWSGQPKSGILWILESAGDFEFAARRLSEKEKTNNAQSLFKFQIKTFKHRIFSKMPFDTKFKILLSHFSQYV